MLRPGRRRTQARRTRWNLKGKGVSPALSEVRGWGGRKKARGVEPTSGIRAWSGQVEHTEKAGIQGLKLSQEETLETLRSVSSVTREAV